MGRNVTRVPYDQVPPEWATHPTIGPFVDVLLDAVWSSQVRQGGDFDKIANLETPVPIPNRSMPKQEVQTAPVSRVDRSLPEVDANTLIGIAKARRLSRNTYQIGDIKYHNSTTNIPFGWQIADGTNGTDDLRDKFILGAGTTYTLDTTGGGVIEATVGGPDDTVEVSSGTGTTVASSTHEHTVTVNPDLPPYYVKVIIQRIF